MTLLITLVRESLFFIHSLAPNWGVAIVVFSVTFKLFLLPIQLLAARESKKLQKLQPTLKQLLETHRESPQAYFRESGKVKKQAGVRSWVLPLTMLIQLPVFMAIYRCIPKIDALHGASFLWLPNLSLADPYYILPVLMFALMYWQQGGRNQKLPVPAWVMPSMSLFFLSAMPAALAIHSVVSMFIQVGGERLMNRLA
jgi:YidC/Oxa1 family membrane protein insertase